MFIHLFHTFGISILVVLGLFVSFGTANIARAQTTNTQVVVMSEAQRRAAIVSLIDQLIVLLEQLYPQIDWDVIRGIDSTDDDDKDDDDEEDEDEDGGDDDDDDDDEDEDDDDEATAIAPVGSNVTRADFTIPLRFSAFGDDMYIEKSAARAATVSSDDGITYVIEDGGGNVYAGGTASAAFTSDSESGDTSGYFNIDKDDDREFILQISFNNTGGTAGFYRAHVVGIAFDDDASAGGEDTISSIFSETHTPVVFVDDEL